MAPPRTTLCWLLCSGTAFAALALFFLYPSASIAIPASLRSYAHDTGRVTTLEQFLYKEEERYGKVIAMRNELGSQAGLDEIHFVPNKTTLEQFFPASFLCPYQLTLVGTSWVCGLERFAESSQCGVYTVGPRDDAFTTDILGAVPACLTTAYTPGPQKFGNGRMYMSASGGGQTGGSGWIGLSPIPEGSYPRPADQAKLTQHCHAGDPLCRNREFVYTLEMLLHRHRHARYADILRIDLPFGEMVPALASLPMPSLSAEDVDSWVLPLGQLILALKLDERSDAISEGYLNFRPWWESLERVGLRPFAVQDRGDDVLEYSFLNIRTSLLFTHPL